MKGKNSKIKSRRCDAGKTKMGLSISALAFIFLAFVVTLFPKNWNITKLIEPKKNEILASMTALGIILWIASSFFD